MVGLTRNEVIKMDGVGLRCSLVVGYMFRFWVPTLALNSGSGKLRRLQTLLGNFDFILWPHRTPNELSELTATAAWTRLFHS